MSTYPKEITDQFELTDLRMAAEYHTQITLVVGSESATQIDEKNFTVRAERYRTGEILDFELEHVADEDENGEPCRFFEAVCVQEREHYEKEQS